MAFHAIFQYNILEIDDTHNTWTNMIVKMTILRLLGSSDDRKKDKIGVTRPEGPPLWGFRYPVSGRGSRGSLSEELALWSLVQKRIEVKSAYRHRLNRRVKKGASVHWASYVLETMSRPRRSFFSTGSTDGASEYTIGAMTSAPRRRSLSTGWTGDASVQSIGSTGGHCVSYQDFNGYFGLWVTGRTDATPSRGIGSSGDTQIYSWPLEQRLQDLVAYIYASPRPFEACWSC